MAILAFRRGASNRSQASHHGKFVLPWPESWFRRRSVTSFIASHEACNSELRKLQEENSRRLPALSGQRSGLREEIRRIQALSDDTERQPLPGLTGRLREVETEIGEFTGRVSRKARECANYLVRAQEEDVAHKERAQKILSAAEGGRSEAEAVQRSAKAAADAQLTGLRATTAQAWSENISAQFKAAWSMIARDWWARLAAAIVFMFCLIVELSPIWGGIALRGGALDQLGELEEEAVHQRVLTQLAAVKTQGETERAVLLEDQVGRVEIVSIRKAAESALDNAEILRQRRDIVREFPDMKDMANTVFATARDKMRDIVLRILGTAR